MTNPFSRINLRNLFDRDPNKIEPHPKRAWGIIFFFGTILSVAVVLLHYFFYISASSVRESGDEGLAQEKQVRLNKKGLADVIATFEAKSLLFEEITSHPEQIPDPSLLTGQENAGGKNSGKGGTLQKAQEATSTVPAVAE